MHHTLTLTDRELTLRPLTEADVAPLLTLARTHAAEYAQMKTPPTLEKF